MAWLEPVVLDGRVEAAVTLAEQGAGPGLVQRVVATGEVAGATGCWSPDATHRRVEIGFTWPAARSAAPTARRVA